MSYLFAAYVAIWCILFLYIYSVSSRQKQLEKTLKSLQESIQTRPKL